ncbi:exodeoxyribonuclease VII, large subunit [Methylocella silvestris BL2]|uniref:Exodeoxyribonuclease 7 large subunit n=1 Tax=Methylocella silvestris (strain DSM 15510 / CIP 108128 / LMG 27833 / NCIMB 13906 / BL2) TaxID=395965 RepID=B8EQV1_METSB|nr:exodeoxyribonuclease VII large subunit [Methylocella silvestris]ACK49372.1 exodeoxyribonuclease VII, large subunit [Methylocella silvestris BL2]
MPEPVASNAPELTVSELSNALKRTIEDRFGFVRLRGEISNYRGPHSSGHAYFCLKDAGARIDAVIWKGVFGRLRVKPEEGLEVIATGKITTFPGKSSYQIIVEAIEPAGVGALMALFEERRRKLAAEGLFDEARKKALPFLPLRVGVITSPTGAVIRDILHRIKDRFPRHVLVWPVRVQGETSAAEVAAAIAGFGALPEDGPLARPHVIIVARGGGSLEDLWSFNEEIVVRAVAASAIPLISAIGHETDWTLIDHAADLRAPTPTGAAEKAVPVRLQLIADVADLSRRHAGAMARLLDRRRSEARALSRALPLPEEILALPRQKLDHAGRRFANAILRAHDHYSLALGRAAQRLARQTPRARMARAGEKLAGLQQRMQRSAVIGRERRAAALNSLGERLINARLSRARAEQERTAAARHRLDVLGPRLLRAVHEKIAARRAELRRLDQLRESLGYKNVLARGFALVRDAEGNPLRLAAAITDGALLDLQFADGHKPAVAGAAPGAPRKTSASRKPSQGSLF